MDKNRKIIAKGTPRNRYLVTLEEEDNSERYLTYTSKKKAEAGFKCSWFFTTEAVEEVFKKEYGYIPWHRDTNGNVIHENFEQETCMEAVEAAMIFEIN